MLFYFNNISTLMPLLIIGFLIFIVILVISISQSVKYKRVSAFFRTFIQGYLLIIILFLLSMLLLWFSQTGGKDLVKDFGLEPIYILIGSIALYLLCNLIGLRYRREYKKNKKNNLGLSNINNTSSKFNNQNSTIQDKQFFEEMNKQTLEISQFYKELKDAEIEVYERELVNIDKHFGDDERLVEFDNIYKESFNTCHKNKLEAIDKQEEIARLTLRLEVLKYRYYNMK